MAALTEVYIEYKSRGLNKVDKNLGKTHKSSKKLTFGLQKLAAVIGTGVLAKAVAGFVSGQIEMARGIDNVSKQLDIQSDVYQTWLGLTRRAGADEEELKEVMLDVAERAGDAATGNETFAETFKALGVNIRDSEGQLKNAGVLFADVTTALTGMEDAQSRLFRARELSGQFNRLFPVINQSTEALEAQKRELRESGAIMSRDYLDSMRRLDSGIQRARQTFQGFLAQALEPLVPAIEQGVGVMQDMLDGLRELARGTDIAQLATVALTVVGVLGLTAALSALGNPITWIVGLIAGLILVVDDLTTAYKGGQSAIKEFFLEHFNYDITGLLDSLVDGWYRAMGVILDLPGAINLAMSNLAIHLGRGYLSVLRFAQRSVDAVRPLLEALSSIPGFGGVGATLRMVDSGLKAAKDRGLERLRINKAESRPTQMMMQMSGARAASQIAREQARARADAIRNPGVDPSLVMSRPGSGATQSSSSPTINQSVTVNASGMSQQQAEQMMSRVMERERRQIMSSVEGA